jgi:RNA polymerase primary sigma factor
MEHAGLIRVPRHTADRIKKLLRAKRELQKLDGCDPSLEQIAQYSGIPEEKAEELLRLMPEVCSLDAPAGEDDGTLQLLLENMHSPQPQEELVRQEMKRLLESLLGLLPDRQQQVLRLRFGMEDGRCYTLDQIGMRLGVSKERARQIEHQAVEKLQKLGAGLGLEDFLE